MHVPPGFTRLFPYLFVEGARAYLAFLVDGLGGEILGVHDRPDGLVANAQVRFGDTIIMVSEAGEGRTATRGTYYLYVEDADAAMARGLAAGGTMESEVGDRVYGDRQGGLRDPAGNIWWLSQRLAPGPY
ncbi:VOC family protein [Sphingomonas sp. HITSZ_GF]|uniref:VOC family protein n=1 Tax=Sphingomonas sp. HITSZ_GF TaxID=3037247 RepID=UPI00240DF463|nr:VOC family protein [Sphingomonas sp. HITSZ_GF]MDG2532253.1 VOC family protein [Sphingomonas sp. HITSZ_GF]